MRKPWIPARRSLLVVAVLAAIAGSLAPAKAEAPQTASFAAQTFAIDAAAGLPSCYLTLGPGGISYYKRANGTTYGTWTWNSSMSCAQNMVYMWTLSHLVKLPATSVYRGSPGVCGTDKLTVVVTTGCRYVAMSGGTYYCDSCNGTWELVSEWRMRFRTIDGKFSSNNSLVCVMHVGALKTTGRLDCTGISKPLTIP